MGNAIFTRCITSPSVLPIGKGGTGATTTTGSCINLGLGDINQMDFSANSYSDWLSAVQTYVDQNLQTRRPFAFHAGWQGIGYGSGLAYYTLDSGFKFLMLFNENERSGVKYYFKRPNENNWNEAATNVGTTLYDNSSGTTGTVNLSDNVANYKLLEICFNDMATQRVYEPNGKAPTLCTMNSDIYNTIYFKQSRLYISGNTMTVQSSLSAWASNDTGMTTRNINEISIYKIIGYK